MADTVKIEARVAIGGLQAGQTGHVPRKLAEMACAKGYAVRVDKLSDRRPSMTGVVSTSMDGAGSVTGDSYRSPTFGGTGDGAGE